MMSLKLPSAPRNAQKFELIQMFEDHDLSMARITAHYNAEEQGSTNIEDDHSPADENQFAITQACTYIVELT